MPSPSKQRRTTVVGKTATGKTYRMKQEMKKSKVPRKKTVVLETKRKATTKPVQLPFTNQYSSSRGSNNKNRGA